jgi:hypothetical protein
MQSAPEQLGKNGSAKLLGLQRGPRSRQLLHFERTQLSAHRDTS